MHFFKTTILINEAGEKFKNKDQGHHVVILKCDHDVIVAALQAEIEKLKYSDHGLYKYGGGCRCDVCRAAKSESQKRYLQNVKKRNSQTKNENY
jgi:hypothetical protein